MNYVFEIDAQGLDALVENRNSVRRVEGEGQLLMPRSETAKESFPPIQVVMSENKILGQFGERLGQSYLLSSRQTSHSTIRRFDSLHFMSPNCGSPWGCLVMFKTPEPWNGLLTVHAGRQRMFDLGETNWSGEGGCEWCGR